MSAAPVSEVASRDTGHEKLVERYRATMRYWSVLVVALVVLLSGCTREITGVAQADPRGPATALSDDGFGIVAGDPNAPVQIELYTEPQCTHCADLQKDFGEELAQYMNLGQLAVTYRPMTFLDPAARRLLRPGQQRAVPGRRAGDVGQGVPGVRQDLWGHQDPGGKGPERRRDRRHGAARAVSRRRPSTRSRPASPRSISRTMADPTSSTSTRSTRCQHRHADRLRPEERTGRSTSTTTTGCPR